MHMSKIRLEQNREKSAIRYFEMQLYLTYIKAAKNLKSERIQNSDTCSTPSVDQF